MAVLEYLAKLGLVLAFREKRGLVLAFRAHFLHDFFRRNFPYLIPHQCHILFLSQDIKQNVLLSSHLDN